MDTIILKDRITTRLTDEEFFWFCQENRDLRIERNNKLEIVIMAPVTTLSNYSSGSAFAQLYLWSLQSKTGLAFDSSTGFTLPDRSVYSPDAAWVSFARWNKLSTEEKDRFAPVCPDFVIEVKSKYDHMTDLHEKMQTWLNNGSLLGWLINPQDEVVFIYTRNRPTEQFHGFGKKLAGEAPVDGFSLDLSLLRI
jgi:Uma2 family endonuclease